MKTQSILGILLIIAGVTILSLRGGFTTTESKPIVEGKGFQVNVPVTEHHEVPRALGWGLTAGGIALLVLGLRKGK